MGQMVQFKGLLEQSNPEIGDRFDDDEALKRVADISSISAKILRSDEEFEQRLESKREQAQQAQQAENAKLESEALKNVAAAEAA
jgi:hypothetical protein